MPECRIELFADATDYDPIVAIGDIAHIEASSDAGPRANMSRVAGDRDQYDNLILLCKNCHTRLDGQKNANTTEVVRQLKANHEDWVRTSLPERGQSVTGWSVFILQGEHPIDTTKAETGLSPDFMAGHPIVFSASPNKRSWSEILQAMIETIDSLFASTDPFDCRFAIFPLAPVSACISLGYLLTSRPMVRLFQYHRDSQTWRWPADAIVESNVTVTGISNSVVESTGKLAICFDLSATILDTDLPKMPEGYLGTIRLSVSSPSTNWLQSPLQLEQLGITTRQTLEILTSVYPRADEWHIFYAGPAPGAVKIGQQFNPTMTPLVQLYEFNRSRIPPYQPSIRLGGQPS